MSDDKVKQLPGTTPIPKFTDIITKMIEELPAQIKYVDLRAQLTRRAYLKLVEEGFTKNEAFQLCTKITGGN